MTKNLSAEDLGAILSPTDPWIVVWVTYDVTRQPYWCGTDDEHVWSSRIEDAFHFDSREAAENFDEFSDFFDSDDIEVRRLYPKGCP